MKIGHLVFGANQMCYGMSLCVYRNNINTVNVTPKTAKCFDIILVSLFWWQHLYDFVNFCEASKIGKRHGEKPRIIVGGMMSLNPLALADYAHQVVVGDGEDVLPHALNGNDHNSIWYDGKKSVTFNQADITDNSFVYTNESHIPRIEIARGCPYRCKFCQISHIKKYREVSIFAFDKALHNVSGKRAAIFAPNKTSHKQYPEILRKLADRNINDMCPDVRFNDVKKFDSASSFQIGVEGISERLRFSVGKKMTDVAWREILEYILSVHSAKGHKPHVFHGFIMDLPSENSQDFESFCTVLDSFNTIPCIDKFCMFIVANLFMPQPFTPFQDEPINIDRDYDKIFRKCLYYRKFAVHFKGRFFSRYNRVLSMIATRAGNEFGEIARLVKNKIVNTAKVPLRIKALDSILQPYGGVDAYCGVPKSHPWDIVKVA